MSKQSDLHEQRIAQYINQMTYIKAHRPKVSASFSDVQITSFYNKDVNVWLEVKMNHTDNLGNPRVYFDQEWKTSYKTPIAKEATSILNDCDQAKSFINDLSRFSDIDRSAIKLSTTRTGLEESNVVPLTVMRNFFNDRNRYVSIKEDYDIGLSVTSHYIQGKEEPVYYMQAGDDFYLISNVNPLSLSTRIPQLEGRGDFKTRVSTRSKFYEIQTELKIKSMPYSEYSILPGTNKKNPFDL